MDRASALRAGGGCTLPLTAALQPYITVTEAQTLAPQSVYPLSRVMFSCMLNRTARELHNYRIGIPTIRPYHVVAGPCIS